MADIRPFRALRYDTGRVDLGDVVTQPYDKITPAMQQGYYKRGPANFVRFELPVAEGQDVYAGAREFLGKMRHEGTIRLEESPAFYVYEQEFEHPTEPKGILRRRALIALGRLHDYADGVVFRHEQTLTGPKKDRQQLLQTTRVQSGLLFLMYDDPRRVIEELKPANAVEFVDDLGVKQRLWSVSDSATIQQIQDAFREQKLFIADGHHRYETALALRRSREGKYAEDFAMMALVNMQSEGLVVLPTHRAVFGLSSERFERGLQGLLAAFGANQLQASERASLHERLQTGPPEHFAMIVVSADAAHVFDMSRAELRQDLPQISCDLDVEVLHALLEDYFEITPADVAAQRFVRYHRYAKDAIEDVRSGGAQAAFLIRPVSVETIRDRSLRGALMPQKSTDFYPKMNSGLTLYSWDESFENPTLATPARVGHPRGL